MSIIKVTEEMLRKFDVLPKAWYPLEIYSIETKPSKNSGTLELRVFARVVSGEKAQTQIMMRFYPHAMGEPFMNLMKAIENVKEIPVGTEIDPNKLVGKQVWCEAKEDMYENKPTNKFEDFCNINETPPF